jgi:oligopeptidase B
MLDTSQALTALEYDEWGNPNEEVYFKEILSYSPYNNIKPEKYPITLNIAAISDQRVRYWEALKYTQKLRANVKNPEDIYLYINTSSGHTGASGRYEYLKEIALEYNFILQQLNIDFEKA